MFHLLGLVLVPLLVAAFAYWRYRETITTKEFLLQLTAVVILGTAGFFIARWGALRSVEHLNGRIAHKDHGAQPCCHCTEECDRCSDGKGGYTDCNCRQVCDHFEDYYWSLKVNLGSTSTTVPVRSCEPNRGNVPKAWAAARIGEPASVENGYTNYLLADPHSLFTDKAPEKYLNSVPDFPSVHDYYKVDKVVLHGGASVPTAWETAMRELNATLGSRKQVDITLLFTRIADPTFADAVEQKWLYGPKNALIIVMGIKENRIGWVRTVTISRVEKLKVALRNDLKGLDVREVNKGVNIIRGHVTKLFNRTAMSDFEYLGRAAKPSTLVLVLLYILQMGVSIGISMWLHREDVFKEEKWARKASPRMFRRRPW